MDSIGLKMLPMRAVRLSVLLIVLIPVFAVLNAAEIYKWKDENGKLHFGDNKPRDRAAEQIDIKSTSAVPVIPSQDERRKRQQRLLRLFEQEREEANIEAQRKKQHQLRSQKNCAFARDRLRSLERSAYVYDLDKQGNRIILPEDRHQASMSAARKKVEHWCR
ncbi:MAG: DUF4124 domain-containing protein [Gammaproteobacteria bacterium]|nr:DUF4124 domain-containing protein [Gammaproteobacteria bacterium]